MTEINRPTMRVPETDPRLPTGEWTGFFQQPGLRDGKGWMELQLSFQAGLVRGEGRDLVGAFVMAGRYDLKAEQVQVHKRYVGLHDVFYRGYAERDRGIWGTWTIGRDRARGGFHIWPKGMRNLEGDTLKAAEPLPLAQDGLLVLAAAVRQARGA